MKIEDVKQKINSYLDGISPEDFLKKFTEQYGMSEYDMNDIEGIPDER